MNNQIALSNLNDRSRKINSICHFLTGIENISQNLNILVFTLLHSLTKNTELKRQPNFNKDLGQWNFGAC